MAIELKSMAPEIGNLSTTTHSDPQINFADPLSPKTWAFIFSIGTLMEVSVLNPRWYEYLVYFLVEAGLAQMTMKASSYFFLKKYPLRKAYFPHPDPKQLTALPVDQIRAIAEDLFKFPKDFAIWCFSFTFWKAIPSFFVILFFFSYSHSIWVQFTLAAGITIANFLFFAGLTYLETNIKISNLNQELKKNENWLFTWSAINLPKKSNKESILEVCFLFFPAIFILMYQLIVLAHNSHLSQAHIFSSVAITGFGGLVLFGRALYLWRKYLLDSIESSIRSIDPNTKSLVPLHSYVPIARIDQTFNQLMTRLDSIEKELNISILNQSEQKRFEALGEMTASIVHDLAAPLHVIKYCSEEIFDKLSEEDSEIFLRMFRNIEKCDDLVHSLRNVIRPNSFGSNQGTPIAEIIKSEKIILETQMNSSQWRKIKFSESPELNSLSLKIRAPELAQIFDNIFRNAIESAKLNQQIHIDIDVQADNDWFEIMISDNGNGLTQENFDLYSQIGIKNETFEKIGLGLRLIRRLVEVNKGKIFVKPIPKDNFSTSIVIRLPIDLAFTRSDESFYLKEYSFLDRENPFQNRDHTTAETRL